jgi:hypothetical protein
MENFRKQIITMCAVAMWIVAFYLKYQTTHFLLMKEPVLVVPAILATLLSIIAVFEWANSYKKK